MQQPTPKRGEITKAARFLGVNVTTVSRRLKNGEVPVEADGTIALEKLQWAWKRLRPDQVSGSTETDEGITYTDARLRNELAHAKERELKVAQLEGKLVPKEQVTDVVFDWFRQERDAIRNIPARFGPSLAAQLGVEARDVIIALEGIIHEYLAERGAIDYPAVG